MPAQIGRIYRDAVFYAETVTGELKPKYFLVLAASAGYDIVARLLTSHYAELRPQLPPCFHGDPYPGFYLGVLGGELSSRSWLDLRHLDDLDAWDFQRNEQQGRVSEVTALPTPLLREALACAASADDTTQLQERRIRDVLAAL